MKLKDLWFWLKKKKPLLHFLDINTSAYIQIRSYGFGSFFYRNLFFKAMAMLVTIYSFNIIYMKLER